MAGLGGGGGYVLISFFLPSAGGQGYEQRHFSLIGLGGQGSLRQAIVYAYNNKSSKT